MNDRKVGNLRECWEEAERVSVWERVPVGQAVTSPLQSAGTSWLPLVFRAGRNSGRYYRRAYLHRECSKWVWGFAAWRYSSLVANMPGTRQGRSYLIWLALLPFRLTGQARCGMIPTGLTLSDRVALCRSVTANNSKKMGVSVGYCSLLTRRAVPNGTRTKAA